MIEDQQRPRYWMITLSLMSGIAILAIICGLVMPLFTTELNRNSVLGFPLGFYFVAQGLAIILIAAVNWAGGRQAEIDRKFGAVEDL